MYQNFIGIDIGKERFYVAEHTKKDVHSYTNNSDGFKLFYQAHKARLLNSLVILETTGGYEIELIKFLQDSNCSVHRANTRQVKHFIRSYGKLGKSDTIDALGLAHYGAERHEKLPLFKENAQKKLLKLIARRSDLKLILVQEKNRLKAPDQEHLKQSFQAVIEVIEKQVESITDQIKEIISQDKSLEQQKELLKNISGIGDITAIQLIALMPELGKVNRKQIASLGGVAPHPNESGKHVGYRFTRGGRKEVKSVLFMAAMAASRGNSALGLFYQKLLASGKKKMVALTALMRKILVIANAKMREFLLENPLIQHS